MVHVFKWLELRCSKQDKKQNGLQSDSKNNKWKYSDVAKIQTNGNHIDWSYLSIDPSTQIFPSNDDVIYLIHLLEKYYNSEKKNTHN